MGEQKLDERKLNIIKVGVIKTEKENIVKAVRQTILSKVSGSS